ncbi:MAG: DUF86 domain-containing protein [Chromatiaceae bacterium]
MIDGAKDDRLYLVHIVEALRKILRYTHGGRDDFLGDEMIQDAVYRNFLVIGEAAKRVSGSTRALDPSVPWRGMAGLRDIMVHQYEGVRADLVWQIRDEQLKALEPRILAIIERLGGVKWPDPGA